MNSILYLPVVRRKFDAAAADQIMQTTIQEFNDQPVSYPDQAFGTPAELGLYLSSMNDEQFAGIIFHNLTFTDAEFIKLVHEYYPTLPILLLAPREPSTGDWLRLNALTGIISSGNYLKSQQHQFEHIYGNTNEKSVQDLLANFIKTASVKADLAQLNIGVVGTFPPGFFFSDSDHKQLVEVF